MSGVALSKVALSRRAIETPASPIRRLVPYADRAKARGIKVYHLNIGQPDIETPVEMMDGYRNIDIKVLSYGPSQGLKEYIDALVLYLWSSRNRGAGPGHSGDDRRQRGNNVRPGHGG